jgi:hypothetical protein
VLPPAAPVSGAASIAMRYDHRMARIDDTLAAATVLSVDGTPHPLGTLWAERPAVLVFLRHFG